MTAFPRTWCRYGLDDIYAKHAAEAENDSAMTWAQRLLASAATTAQTLPTTIANLVTGQPTKEKAKDESNMTWTRRLLTPTMAGVLSVPVTPIQKALARPLIQEKELLDAALLDATYKATRRPSPMIADLLNKQRRLIAKAQGLRPDLNFEHKNLDGPAYYPEYRTIAANTTRPEILAHEMGHSLNHATLRRLLGDKRSVTYPTFLRTKFPKYGQLAAMLLMMSENKDTRDLAPWLAAATHVPTVTGELLASIRGMRNYGKGLSAPGPFGRSRGGIKPYGLLARALSTYLLGAAGPSLAMWATNRLNDRLYKK